LIPQDIAKKIFSLPAKAEVNKICIVADDKKKMDDFEQEEVNLINTQSAGRNCEFFDNEVDKLDKWSDDMKTALELDLKKLDIDIKSAKTLAKKHVNLDEKLKAQRTIKEMEKKRNEMRKKLYEAQDEVDNRRESLISRIETRLKQKARLTTLFSIKWRIA
jgi:hypothetical protein